MVQVKPFKLDQWAQTYRPLCKVSLIDSCVSPLSLSALEKLSDAASANVLDQSLPFSYGPIRGSPELRSHIAGLFSDVQPASINADHVILTPGTILANFLVLDTLCGPGDHVIVQYPTYQQLYSVPRRSGATVSLWKMRPENGWLPDIEELEKLIEPNTKMIIINNPSNPTGTTLPPSLLSQIVSAAAKHSITILADEVFSPLFHLPASEPQPPSLLSLGYPNVIATGSVSKGFALPGIRVGWIATTMPDVLEKVMRARDYTTISVSQLDQMVASFALNNSNCVKDKIVSRSLKLCAHNIDLLAKFVVQNNDLLSWTRPTGAGTAFVRIRGSDGKWIDDEKFCRELVEATGLMVVPGGYCFGTEDAEELKGYLRIGFVCEAEEMARGLDILGKFIEGTLR